jgi:hypothetical protein
MFTNDYLMRMILRLVQAMTRSLNINDETDRKLAIESLENSVADSVNIDPDLLYNLMPDSMVSMLNLGDFDERLGGYVVRSLYRIAELYDEQGSGATAELRRSQADAISQRWQIGLDSEDLTQEALDAFLQSELEDQD